MARSLTSTQKGGFGMRRRKFLQLAGGAATTWPPPVLAQQSAGFAACSGVHTPREDAAVRRTAALRDALKQAGLVEGMHYVLAMCAANGDIPKLSETRPR